MIVDKIINLTPNEIRIIVNGNTVKIKPLPPEEFMKEKEIMKDVGTENVGNITLRDKEGNSRDITVNKNFLYISRWMPGPLPGVIFIATLELASLVKRKDVLAIGETVKDEDGNIIDVKSFLSFI